MCVEIVRGGWGIEIFISICTVCRKNVTIAVPVDDLGRENLNPRISSQECDLPTSPARTRYWYFNPRIPSQECDFPALLASFNSPYFNPRTPSQECDYDSRRHKHGVKHFNPRTPSQECDSKNYQIFFYSLQFLTPIVPLLSRKLNHYIFTAPYFPINFQFSSANPPAFSCPLRIRTMCLLRFSAHCLQSPIARF